MTVFVSFFAAAGLMPLISNPLAAGLALLKGCMFRIHLETIVSYSLDSFN